VDVRTFIRQRPSVAAALAGVMIVGAAVAIFVQARDLGSSGPGKAFFTTDDGNTFFVDSAAKLPPFDKNGKPAYRAHVFECGGKRVVGFMSGYTPEALKLVEEAQKYKAAGKRPPNMQQLARVGTMGLMVKKPGNSPWVPQADAASATAVRVHRCADGSTPQEVEP
jgi:hypothetical protein